MERVTLRVPKEQMDELRRLVDEGEFANQSEGIRIALREMLKSGEGAVAMPRAKEHPQPGPTEHVQQIRSWNGGRSLD